MNTVNYRLSLDLFDTLSQTTIKAKKGDSACKIHITLTKNGKIFKIGDGCYATFNAKKSDGNFIYNTCTIEGDTIVYDFLSSLDDNGACQVSAVEGNVDCEVTLYNANGEQLTSSRFTLYIDGVIYNGEEIISTPQNNVLKDLIVEANNTINEIETKLENGEFDGTDGEDGGYYKPSLYDDGTLLFIPSKNGMPPLGSVGNIKGQKGDPGYTPQKGVDYFDGKDGYTPQKGVDYFDGKDGNPGAKGDDGKSAYEYAVEGGYEGSEEEFAQKIALDPDWIATKKVMGGEEVYIAQQTLSSGLWDKLQMNFQVGLTYDVYINGEIYPCVAGNEDGGIYLGNITLMDSGSTKDHNNEPFCVYWAGAGATGGFFYKDSRLSYPLTLKVTNHADYVYSQMPKEYLPDEAALKTDIPTPDYKQNTPDAVDYIKNRPFYSEYITLFEQSNSNVIYGTIGVSAKFDLYIGEEYKVTINGTVYNSVCKYSDQEGKILGNPKYYSGEDNGESYGISLKNGKLRGAFADISTSPTNLKIEYESIKKMEKKYLPDGVALKTDIPEDLGMEVIEATADEMYKGVTLSVTGAEVFEKFNAGKHVVIRADFGEKVVEFEYFATDEGCLCFNAYVPTNHQGYYTLDEYVLEIDNDSEKTHYYYDVLRPSSGSSGGGGTSIDVTADVGQTIIVKEVDANGKPTKWESADYQPRTHYMETVLPVTTGEVDPAEGLVMLPPFELAADETYNVKYNGAEYICKCFRNDGTFALGNLEAVGVPGGNGEPFIVAIESYEGELFCMVMDLTGATSSTISISRSVPIPQAYLTNAFPYYIEVSGSGTTDDPYTCNETYDEITTLLGSGRDIRIRRNMYNGDGSLLGEVIYFYNMKMMFSYKFDNIGAGGFATDPLYINTNPVERTFAINGSMAE